MRMNRRTLQLAACGDFVRGRVERMAREAESGTHGCGGQESVKNYVDRMQAGLRQRLGVCGAGSDQVIF